MIIRIIKAMHMGYIASHKRVHVQYTITIIAPTMKGH